jgi:hypothetical protein
LAEISIPNATVDFSETAQVLQPLTDVTEGTLSQIDPTDDTGIFLGGNLVYNGRLITSAYTFYDADASQTVSHGVSSNLNLADTNNFDGWYGFEAAANPRSFAGYMGLIPPEWQSALGGPALTGQGGLSILSASSFGPALTVFEPDDVGTQNPLPGTTVTFYPEGNPLPDAQFNWATNFSGIAFPSGTRSVLVFGRHGENFCYGTGSDCNDPCSPYQGAHAYPYYFRVWAYDALDFLDVINGTQQPWEVQPYAFWTLSEIDNSGCAAVNFGGGTYDLATGRFFITEEFEEEPAVHVYQINVPDDDSPCDPLTGMSLTEGRQLGGLYTTWFGRVPDKAGWEFWRNIVVNDLLTMPQIAEQFSMSAEAHAIYDYLPGDVGPDVDAAQRAMVTMFYENLFNRMPDTAGFNFWLNELQANNEFYSDELSLNMIGGASPDDLARIDANIALIPC